MRELPINHLDGHLARSVLSPHHREVWRRRPEPEPALDRQTADDLIRKIMDCDDKVERVLEILEGEDEEEETDTDT